MGERKGQNKYYPPDYDPKKGGLNKWQGTHALRERAAKIHLGILIIRFEMPFNVWCDGCGAHVGMGVRYNAEKKKVGMYYTTPLYEFRMKCHLCSNYFVIRTDPQKFDYELVEGLRRQERRWDMSSNEQIASTEKETSKKLATDAMFKLEHGELDVAKSKAQAPELEELEAFQDRMKDDFARNQELRKIFRTRKKEIKQQAEIDNSLLKKSSLAIELLPESSEDVRLAGLLSQYKTTETSDEKLHKSIERLDNESIFSKKRKPSNVVGITKTKNSKAIVISNLKRSIIASNIRQKMNNMDSGMCLLSANIVKKPRKDEDRTSTNGAHASMNGKESSIDESSSLCASTASRNVDNISNTSLSLLKDLYNSSNESEDSSSSSPVQ